MATALPIIHVPDLPDKGLLVRVDGIPVLIAVKEGLEERAERCVVAHELRHAEDSFSTEDLPPLMQRRNETRVDRDAAASLLSPAALREWLADRARSDEPITVHEIALEFGVTSRYVELVLAIAGHPSGRR